MKRELFIWLYFHLEYLYKKIIKQVEIKMLNKGIKLQSVTEKKKKKKTLNLPKEQRNLYSR